MTTAEPPQIDTTKAHPARIYDYFLGGKDNYPADREAAERVLAVVPSARQMARANRAFLQRAVRFLAGEAGIRQFLDVGTGIPTQGNVHEVAQQVTSDARVMYVDNDLIVHVHANALLAGDNTAAVLADLREPDAILGHPEVRKIIDFDQPVALLLVAILHFIEDEEDPAGIVACLRDAMAPGSYLAISHATGDFDLVAATTAAAAYDKAAAPMVLRSHAEVERLFNGFALVDPGLVQVSHWRPDRDQAAGHQEVWAYGGVGRKTAHPTPQPATRAAWAVLGGPAPPPQGGDRSRQ
jgi:S-adenosyl methyltransferase